MTKKDNSMSKDTVQPVKDIINNIDGLPEETKKAANTKASLESLSISGEGPGELMLLLPLMAKMDKEHITKVLENQETESNNKYIAQKTKLNHKLIITIISIVAGFLFLGMLIFSLKLFENNTSAAQIISDIFKYLIGAVFGFLGGFGIRYISKK